MLRIDILDRRDPSRHFRTIFFIAKSLELTTMLRWALIRQGDSNLRFISSIHGAPSVLDVQRVAFAYFKVRGPKLIILVFECWYCRVETD